MKFYCYSQVNEFNLKQMKTEINEDNITCKKILHDILIIELSSDLRNIFQLALTIIISEVKSFYLLHSD